jgi:signal transduction histidine kinase/streptogramin lyase
MMKMRLCVVMIFGIAQWGYAQLNYHVHRRYTSDNGLSHSWVRCIHQDELGFMWFGTKDGLNRFDGQQFIAYNAIENGDDWLANSNILDIKPLGRHQLLICTGGGAFIFDYLHNRFERIVAIPKTEVNTAVRHPNGDWWFATSDGLFALDTSMQLKHHFTDQTSVVQLSNRVVQTLFVDKNHTLWVGTIGGLNLLDVTTFTNHQFYAKGDSRLPIGSVISKILPDRHGNIFIAITGYGVDYCKAENLKLNSFVPEHLVDGSAIDLLFDRQGDLWVSNTRQYGVFQLRINSDFTFHQNTYLHDQAVINSISGDNTDCLFEDKWGDIWIGTYMQGVNHLSRRHARFRNIQHSFLKKGMLSHNVVNCLLDDGTFLWVGTEKGLNRFHKKTAALTTFFHHPSDDGTIGSNEIYQLYIDSKKRLWVGTWAGGLNLYNYSTNRFTRFLHNPDDSLSLPSNHVYAISEDDDGKLWLGLIRGQFGWFDPDLQRFYKVYSHPSGELLTNINDILPDTGGMWLSTYANVLFFQPQTNNWDVYPHLRKGGDLTVLFRDSKGNIWFGSEGGVSVLSSDRSRFRAYTMREGLASNSIKSIEEDSENNIWLSTNKGISKIADGINLPLNAFVKNYYANDGLQGSEFNVRASCKSMGGNLVFGGVNGLTWFHPDSITLNKHAPSVFITGFRVVGDSVCERERHLFIADTVHLTHSRNSFVIDFAALNFLASSQNQFRYRLHKWDREWIDARQMRSVTYNNVAPGRYRFMVQASNNDGVWNDIPALLHVVILPAWYSSWWARVLWLVIVVLVIWRFYKWRIHRLSLQKLALEQKVAERTHELVETNRVLAQKKQEVLVQNEELEMHRCHLQQMVAQRTIELEEALEKAEQSDRLKTSFLANMSHEIRTPMNAIVGFASLLEAETTDQTLADYVQIINANCQSLLVLINDIIDLSVIETENVKITPRVIDVYQFLCDIEQHFSIVKADVPIVFAKNVNAIQLEVDEIRLRQIFTNLIDNAIKYTHQGQVLYGYDVRGETIRFYVSDTGIGISDENKERLFTPFGKLEAHNNKIYRGTGLGLSITKRLVDLMGGTIFVESAINKGTTFYIELPLRG